MDRVKLARELVKLAKDLLSFKNNSEGLAESISNAAALELVDKRFWDKFDINDKTVQRQVTDLVRKELKKFENTLTEKINPVLEN